MRLVALTSIFFMLSSCRLSNNPKQEMEDPRTANNLINETSPYLLQHAYNPVQWLPWGEDALERAKKENKLIIISIGYSSCHWCHVMEHESFENEEVAALMNEHFISIKVDREERPDIDQVYMTAVQLMTGSGGWPLNCITLPDGRPVYGGTYFPKASWINVLNQLQQEFRNNPKRMEEYAAKLASGVQQVELIDRVEPKEKLSTSEFEEKIREITGSFDQKRGGFNRAPKFPIPNNLEFFLQYYQQTRDSAFLSHVITTLDEMGNGGIYDQVGGGFARYSVDADWKIPHFEKMLYDNAQLISVYSHAYQLTGNSRYKKIVEETFEFLNREMKGKEELYYSALDADSEGEEGKFYVWKEAELKEALGANYDKAVSHFNVGSATLWEHGNHHLLRNPDSQLTDEEADELRNLLLKTREGRVKPGLDDKSLTSWNGLMISGLVDAYKAFGDERYLQQAETSMNALLKHQLNAGRLNHSFKNSTSTINGFLEDYAFVSTALIELYEVTLEVKYLHRAKEIADHAIEKFADKNSGMMFFTSADDPALIARKTEVGDNVIPASNSAMAIAIEKLGRYLDDTSYASLSQTMIQNMEPHLLRYPSGYTNWARLWMMHHYPYYEVAVCGTEAKATVQNIAKHYLPNAMILGTVSEEHLPLLRNKVVADQTTVYVCVNKSCKAPTTDYREALEELLP